MPAFRDAPAVQEVSAIALQSIAAARRFIYIENQYLTSAAVGAALARRLAEPDGPEVIAVLPREEHGWLEQSSMGVMRARLLRHLRASDHHGRLRLFYPTIPALDESACMNVHAKVMIVDDRWARVGSANLSNRSMGLDTECDLVLDAELDPRLGAGDRVAAQPADRRAPRLRPAVGRGRAGGARVADRAPSNRCAAGPDRWRRCPRPPPTARRRPRTPPRRPPSAWRSSTGSPAIPNSPRPTSCWRCWFPRACARPSADRWSAGAW